MILYSKEEKERLKEVREKFVREETERYESALTKRDNKIKELENKLSYKYSENGIRTLTEIYEDFNKLGYEHNLHPNNDYDYGRFNKRYYFRKKMECFYKIIEIDFVNKEYSPYYVPWASPYYDTCSTPYFDTCSTPLLTSFPGKLTSIEHKLLNELFTVWGWFCE